MVEASDPPVAAETAGRPAVADQVARIPCVEDPRWWQWCRPLAAFLATGPKTWVQLEVWGIENGETGEMLRQLLCAMEHRGEAGTEGEGEQLVWRHYPRRKRRRR